jgi:hypothetical protein
MVATKEENAPIAPRPLPVITNERMIRIPILTPTMYGFQYGNCCLVFI